MVSLDLSGYHVGVAVGALAMWGVLAAAEGAEVLAFDGVLIEWTPLAAALSVVTGVAALVLAALIHRWWLSVVAVARRAVQEGGGR